MAARSLSVTRAGIKRLFNTIRDICYYRCGRLKSEIIKELILYRYTTKFSIKDTEIKELHLVEAEVEKEESADFLEDSKYNLISDNKEEEEKGGESDRIQEVSPSFPAGRDRGSNSNSEIEGF
ncbi:uncharacterized protein N7518_004957 [Penicillium psychrosexuale]|uniref:uncharacterized protein n=1 Tax=Penicillium psychrosexuale TaxID=1002107 RepID=UPI002545AA49|nr:uncharacterized protein N7518_004957 [Penicillium psychrosexuale]KAJ5796417.1 hypothetical protein N7518_004957 [Penicillium psychrosexuale]